MNAPMAAPGKLTPDPHAAGFEDLLQQLLRLRAPLLEREAELEPKLRALAYVCLPRTARGCAAILKMLENPPARK